MKQVYVQSFIVNLMADEIPYVYAEKISPGMVLRVNNFFTYAPQRRPNEQIIMGIRNGEQEIIIRSASPGPTQNGLSTYHIFWIGEGHQLYAYFPHARYAEQLSIHATGILYTLDEWQKIME